MFDGIESKQKESLGEEMMDDIGLKEQLYQVVFRQLKEFAKSEEAKEVYAIAFDLGEFDYVMRYQTTHGYWQTKAEYRNCYEYQEEYFMDESLTGFKYSVGDFGFVQDIAEEKPGASQELIDFFDSMGYYICDYIEDESRLIPREQLPEDMYQFLLEACLYCAVKLKDKLDFLDKTDDFIIFVSEHDSSNERKIDLMSRTVDRYFF